MYPRTLKEALELLMQNRFPRDVSNPMPSQILDNYEQPKAGEHGG